MAAAQAYSKGDWIVHTHYGIGQIKGVEVKGISGAKTRYFRIEATNSTFWMPVDNMNGETSRPLSTLEEMEQAIAVLQKPAREMSSSHIERQARIKRVRSANTPEDIARLIRDLRARERVKGILNQNERSAYGMLRQQLIEEWTLVTGTEVETVNSRLDKLLNRQEAAVEA